MNGECKYRNVDDKIFNDPVHRSMNIPALCVAICDTPQFQRLRNIKQLGLGVYVYPGANHTRFDHCLGVCYLAGEFVKILRDKQKSEINYGIDDKDILCVQVAGLCHDIGHGPFSHFWEHFVHKAQQNVSWKHEVTSVEMFDYLIKTNGLIENFQFYFGEHFEKYLTLIREQFGGSCESRKQNPWIINGRDKSFLYEIVANKLCGVDVDKFDYLARDCYYMGITVGFDHWHLMKFARVCQTEDGEGVGSLHICYRDKELEQVANMFRARRTLHKVGFQHRVVIALDAMLMDLMLSVDEHFLISGSKGKLLSLSEVHTDMEAFSKLNDQILYTICLSSDHHLNDAKSIWNSIQTRKLYKYIAKAHIEKSLAQKITKEPTKFSDEIYELVEEGPKEHFTSQDIVLNMQVFNNGDVQQPLYCVYFYSKADPSTGRKLQDLRLHNLELCTAEEIFVLCFCKKPSFNRSINAAFYRWCCNNNLDKVQE
ncbi:SAM domain and HD [Chamberlinius hualienensis]